MSVENKRKILQFRKYELDYERSNRPLMSHLKKHQMFGRPNFLPLLNMHIFLQDINHTSFQQNLDTHLYFPHS